MGLVALLSIESRMQFSLADIMGVAELLLCLLVLPYFQHRVLRPKLFRKMADKTPGARL